MKESRRSTPTPPWVEAFPSASGGAAFATSLWQGVHNRKTESLAIIAVSSEKVLACDGFSHWESGLVRGLP